MTRKDSSEPLLFDGANEEFVRPVFEIPYRLEINLTMETADDSEPWNRQPLSRASSSR
jgi:hypothetical protein